MRSTAVIFLTGNPGCIDYYGSFLTRLAEDIGVQNLHCLTFANFDRPLKNVLSLQEQIAHIRSQLNAIITSSSTPLDIIVVGHSVGAYVGLELVQGLPRREDAQIVGFIGLWPTVAWIAQSRSGRRLGVRGWHGSKQI